MYKMQDKTYIALDQPKCKYYGALLVVGYFLLFEWLSRAGDPFGRAGKHFILHNKCSTHAFGLISMLF